MSRVAAIDIGTNTVRLLVADVGGGTLRPVERRAAVVGLGQGVDATRRLDPAARERTLAALTGFGDILRQREVGRRRAVATSASRDAADAEGFLRQVERVLGVLPEVVTGDEEAALSFRGAMWGVRAATPALVVDPGGGSTELVFGTDRPERTASVDIGSVRLTERVLRDRPAPAHQLAEAQAMARSLLTVPEVTAGAAAAIGVGGTFTSLAAIYLDLEAYDADRVHGAVMNASDLEALVARLAGLSVEETAAIPSLEPARAPVLLAGAVIAAEAVASSGLGAVTVSESDLLEGIVLGMGG